MLTVLLCIALRDLISDSSFLVAHLHVGADNILVNLDGGSGEKPASSLGRKQFMPSMLAM
jgi:hypothetical protein